jgi:antirestriction protein ArdC
MKTSSPKKDMYAQITDEIIAMLESGTTSQITWGTHWQRLTLQPQDRNAVSRRKCAVALGSSHEERLFD